MRTTDQILASLSSDDAEGRSLPDRLCRDATDALELLGGAVSLQHDEGQPQTVVGASGPAVRRLEEIQHELGEGPGVDALRLDRVELHPDLAHDGAARWPVFSPIALDVGVRSLVALPLRVGAVRLGNLGLYSTAPRRLGHDVPAATEYADAAVAVLLQLQAGAPPGDNLHPELVAPVAYRAEVHQATGYLSVRADVAVGDALLLLRARAYSSDRPLLDVARDVLAGTLQIRPEEDHDGH